MVTFVTLLAFSSAFLLVFGLNLLYSDAQQRRRVQTAERLRADRLRSRSVRHVTPLSQPQLQAILDEESQNEGLRKPVSQRLQLYLRQAGMRWQPMKIMALVLGGTAVASIAMWWLTGSVFVASLAGPVGACCPFLFIAVRHRKRMGLMLAQLPDAYDMIARSLRAGQTFAAGLQSTIDELSSPLADEFGYCSDQQNLGVPAEIALRDLARRTGLLEVRIFTLAVSIHRQTGGNLAELLENLADVIRQRYRVQGLIQSLTAEGRFQAYILMGLPVFLLGLMTFLNRSYAAQLYSRPGLLFGTAVSMLIGGLWMRRIVNFDF